MIPYSGFIKFTITNLELLHSSVRKIFFIKKLHLCCSMYSLFSMFIRSSVSSVFVLYGTGSSDHNKEKLLSCFSSAARKKRRKFAGFDRRDPPGEEHRV